MSAQNAMKFFQPGVLLITPGGPRGHCARRLHGQLTPRARKKMAGIVLTGGLRPSPSVLKVIQAMPIPVLLAQKDSYQVASKVHNLTVKTRPNDSEKNFPHPRTSSPKKRQPQENPASLVIPHARPTPRSKPCRTYQPGRPIEEVARELNLPASEIIKLASKRKIRSAPRPSPSPRCKKSWRT